jgi:uncharacterized protein (TIGR03067 family)
MLLVSGRAGAGVIPEAVAVLMEAVMKSMMRSKLSKVVAGLMALSAVAFGGALLTDRTAVDQPAKREQVGNKPVIDRPAPLERHNGSEEKPGPTKTDLDRLQGVGQSSRCNIGEGIEPAKLEEIIFMVDGKRASLQNSDGGLEGGLYLDPASNPKTFDLAMSKKTIEGIYSLDGDTLRLCYDLAYPEVKRPASFTTEKDGQVLLVLKRTHGPEIFPLLDGTRAFPKLIELTPPPEAPPARSK